MKHRTIYRRKKYMCVGGDRHCLSIFGILEEKQKKIFVQAIISTICLSYEMSF